MPIKKKEVIPPDILYHGTTHAAISKIQKEGLKPMRRRYVHPKDIETALAVGKRRDDTPILLKVDAKKPMKTVSSSMKEMIKLS